MNSTSCRPSRRYVGNYLADVPCSIAGDAPVDVIGAGRLTNWSVVHLELHENAARVGELAACGNANLPSAVDDAVPDGEVVAVLNQDGVIPVVGQVDILDLRGPGHGHAEDATAAASRVDSVDPDVGGGVLAVAELSVVVRKSQSGVARSGTDVVSFDVADPDVGRLLHKEPAFANIPGDNSVNVQAVDVPDFNRVAPRAGDGDCAHSSVVVESSITVESDAETTAEVERDLSQVQVPRTGEAQSKVRIAGHLQVRDADVVLASDLDRTAAGSVAHIHGAADLEGLAAGHGDG